MIAQRLQRVLMGWCLVCLSFGLLPKVAFATAPQQEATPDGQRAQLLAKKSEEWQILRELGELTVAPVDSFTPVYTDTPFTQLADGTIQFGEQSYRRYVPVASAAELTAALATANAGDFIHLRDGLYAGNFVIDRSGQADQPIALYGSRQAILQGQSIKSGAGLHLQADYWRLLGFTIRNSATGLLFAAANHNLVSALQLHQIGNAAIHLQRASRDNRLEKSWIYDVGLATPALGNGIIIGSAATEWATVSGGNPDRSDRNQVIGNVFGHNLSAESIVVQAGTTGGRIENNSFRTDKMLQAKSWVALMGNGYVVTGNLGAYAADTPWRLAVALSQTDGWGQDNTIAENQEFETTATPAPPFFVPAPTVANLGIDSFTKSAYLILPARLLPYTLSELAAYFPETVQTFGATTLLRENLLVGNHASLRITTADAHRVRLLSTPERFVSLNGFNSQIDLHGSATQQLVFESWDVVQAQPDVERYDGRAYVLAAGGRMDIADAGFFDLGYEEGTVSGVSWKSLIMRSGTVLVYGNVSNSHFVRNFFGAYTYEAVDMRWIGNTFAHNIRYGFDPHDFSDYFLVEANVAHNNGSHGIIFSRGCQRNIIRNNQSYDNAGHGIMLDDGRVVPDGENERHLAVVPSDNNVIEGNLVTNNDDGIVIEGGSYNIIRNNTIIGPHRYGIRLKDNVAHTEVISNTIKNSERFAIYVYNNSTNSRIEQNTITEAAGALFLQDAPTTTVTANVAQNITELVIALQGNVAGSHIADNRFSGAGQQVLSQMATGLTVETIVNANEFTQGRRPAPPLLPIIFISAWLLILLMLAVAYIRRTIQRRRARPDQYQRMPL